MPYARWSKRAEPREAATRTKPSAARTSRCVVPTQQQWVITKVPHADRSRWSGQHARGRLRSLPIALGISLNVDEVKIGIPPKR
jgi:hypothetical protein